MTGEKESENKDILTVLNEAKEIIELYQRQVEDARFEPIENLNQVVREERKKQKISLDLLAKLSGVSIGTLLAIESGKRSTNLSNVQKVLQALGKKLWIK